jgi:hypothetical protein
MWQVNNIKLSRFVNKREESGHWNFWLFMHQVKTVVSQTKWFEMVSECGQVDWFGSGMVRVWIGNGSGLEWFMSGLVMCQLWIGSALDCVGLGLVWLLVLQLVWIGSGWIIETFALCPVWRVFWFLIFISDKSIDGILTVNSYLEFGLDEFWEQRTKDCSVTLQHCIAQYIQRLT